MVYCKPLIVPISMGSKLSVEKSPTTPIEMEDMVFIPYVSVVGGMMYVIVYTRLDISHILGVLSQFMTNPKHEYWATMKRVFRDL